MVSQQNGKHEWVYEVLLDLSMYAKKNDMPELLRQIRNSYENLLPELGTGGRLSELRQLFDSAQKEQPGCVGAKSIKVVPFRPHSGRNSRPIN